MIETTRPRRPYPNKTLTERIRPPDDNVPVIACLNPSCAQYCGVTVPIFCRKAGIMSNGIHSPPMRAPTRAMICVRAIPILFVRMMTEIANPIPVVQREIGRASCRERGEKPEVEGSLEEKQ